MTSDVEVVEADGDRADVDDGVDGPHLVKHHSVGCGAVRGGLGFGKLAKDREGERLGARGELGALDDSADVGHRAVRVRVAVMVVVVMVAVAVLGQVVVAELDGARVLVVVRVLGIVLMRVRVLCIVRVIVLVFAPVIVRVLVSALVPVEPGHVVVVVLKAVGEAHVKVAGGKAALAHARHDDVKAAYR